VPRNKLKRIAPLVRCLATTISRWLPS
jgi:hypothetical protein